MTLTCNLILDGRSIPRGTEIDPSLIPEHIKKEYDFNLQASKKLPSDFRGPKLARKDGTIISNQEEYNRAFREREEEIMRHSGVPFYDLAHPDRVIEPVPEEEQYYDTRHNQGLPEPLPEKTLEAWQTIEGEEQLREATKRGPGRPRKSIE